jgi:hypothetical protein
MSAFEFELCGASKSGETASGVMTVTFASLLVE